MASFEQLVFEIIAKDRNASAAFDRFRRSVDQTSGSLDKNTSSLDKNQKAQTSVIGAAVGIGTAFSAMTTPVAAAGVGVAAFATLAVPSIAKITQAVSGPKGLAKAWATMDQGQKNVALSVTDLKNQYLGLARAMEPQVFQVFNSGLRLAGSLLGPVDQLAVSAGRGIENFVSQFTVSSGVQQFISFLAKEAGPALTLIGQDVTVVSHAIFSLLESFGGLGLAELKAFTAVLTALSDSISWLSQHAGGLTSVAVGLGGVALALSKLGLLTSVLKLTGITAAAEAMRGFAAATAGATLAQKALLATETVVAEVNPFAWIALGVGGAAALAYALRNVQSGIEANIAAMAKQDQASGLNVAGYQKLSQAAGAAAGNLARVQSTTVMVGQAAGHAIALQQAYSDTQQKAAETARNLSADFADLGSRYGLTTDQVKTLIVRSGSLNDILAANGRITPTVAEKIKAWAETENRATGQTNVMAIAVQTLTDAMDKNITAVLTLQGDELAWRSAMQQATAQLASNNAGLRGNSANAIANKQAVLQATTAAIAFAKEQLTSKSNLAGASQEVQAQIRWLKSLKDQSGFTKIEIRALVGWLRQIKSEQANIDVHGTGTWSIVSPAGGRKHLAGGGRVPGFGGGDRWPALLEGGEAVVPKHLTPAVAPFLKAHGVPGFASGGVAGSYSDGVSGLSGWLSRENNATLRAMEQSTANAILAAIRLSQAGAFGGSAALGGDAAADMALARRLFPWPASQWPPFVSLEMREAGFNRFALNPSTGAYGIPQALPPSKMPFAAQAAGGSHAGPQLGWMFGYIGQRYGNPAAAWAHEVAAGWYDRGGWLPPGVSLAVNNSGGYEQVLPRSRGGNRPVVVLEVASTGSLLDRALTEWLHEAVRVKGGGDVQVAFGTR